MDTSLYQEQEPDKTQELKKNMFLDFGAGSSTKQQKFASLLASPDMNMLKMASPELEKMLLASNSLLQTPTPTQFIYPKYVTDEQEAYARGFVEALAQLQNGTGMPGQPGQIIPNTSVAHSSGIPGSSQDSKSTEGTSTEPPTYSTLMPMSSAPPTQPMSASNAATTLANMSAANPPIGIPQKRPYQFVPSALAAPTRPPTSTVPSSSAAMLGLPQSAGNLSVRVKDEPPYNADHTVPSGSSQVSPAPSSSRLTDSPGPLSPGSTNMDNEDGVPMHIGGDQEVMKVERKRARNRIAARKCRTRKLERISRLEEKVSELKNRNNDLLQHATSLNEQVVQLKQQIMDHMKTGCQIMMPNAQNLSQS